MFGTTLPSLVPSTSVSGPAQAVDPDEAPEPDVGALQGLPPAPLLRRGQEEGGAQQPGLQGGKRRRGSNGIVCNVTADSAQKIAQQLYRTFTETFFLNFEQ